jgi:hypothetical protein
VGWIRPPRWRWRSSRVCLPCPESRLRAAPRRGIAGGAAYRQVPGRGRSQGGTHRAR